VAVSLLVFGLASLSVGCWLSVSAARRKPSITSSRKVPRPSPGSIAWKVESGPGTTTPSPKNRYQAVVPIRNRPARGRCVPNSVFAASDSEWRNRSRRRKSEFRTPDPGLLATAQKSYHFSGMGVAQTPTELVLGGYRVFALRWTSLA